MRKKGILLIIIVMGAILSSAQSFRISGNIRDSSAKQNALLMAIRFQDSSLVNYSRSNREGVFKSVQLPLDTYIVIIAHPSFNDRTYLLVPGPGDTAFHFKNVSLPPKSVQLTEVEIIAHKDKMYYKGDTLQFTADSFKVRANASVEDLLRKLPGVKVDAAGKITIQGKQVDQVLVDGDEFFGTDPTIATRNLNANTVETIQVYDTKGEAGESGNDETLKVVNLKLKEDAKKGYFGKLSGATDLQKFYENDVLANRFKKNMKVSVFGLATNTPKQAFGWGDAYQYGINDNGNVSYDPETNSWTSTDDGSKGIPQTLKSGFYFSDRYGKYTKVNSDYTFKQTRLSTGSEINTQFFLEDTSYSNRQHLGKDNLNQSHAWNLSLTTRLDSLTEITLRPKVSYSSSRFTQFQNDEFISSEGLATRQTKLSTGGSSQKTEGSLGFRLNRSFMKKDRLLQLNYSPSYLDNQANSDLETRFVYLQKQLPDSTLTQQRSHFSNKQEHSGSVSYTEPFGKKWKGEISYGIAHNLNRSTRTTRDFNGLGFDIINPLQSNDFKNTRISHRAGSRLTYEVKKYRLSVGANYRHTEQENLNLSSQQKLHHTFRNINPYANANFRISQGSNLHINYHMQTNLPDLQQLQPVIDNSDPNRIRTGNPDLKVELNNNINLNYYFYKGLRDINLYAGAYFNHLINDITDRTSYDSIGRAFTVPVNVDGNFNGNTWLGGGFPIMKRWMKVVYQLNTSVSHMNNYVNDVLNTTNRYGIYPNLGLEKEMEWMEVGIGGEYNYDVTTQSINRQTNQNYYSYGWRANLQLKLPKKFKINGEARYTDNGNRSPGYNINYLIVNAYISKSFFKDDRLTVMLQGFDLLNQNISNERFVNASTITDTKTEIIKRYFLLNLVYKFNSQKSKNEAEEEDD